MEKAVHEGNHAQDEPVAERDNKNEQNEVKQEPPRPASGVILLLKEVHCSGERVELLRNKKSSSRIRRSGYPLLLLSKNH